MKKENKEEQVITDLLLNKTFSSLTYSLIRAICTEKKTSSFDANEVKIKDSVEELMFGMFTHSLGDELAMVLVNDLGVEYFCERWIAFICSESDKLKVRASGEFEVLNFKINCFINKVYTKK